jgi:hypothetical protein
VLCFYHINRNKLFDTCTLMGIDILLKKKCKIIVKCNVSTSLKCFFISFFCEGVLYSFILLIHLMVRVFFQNAS